MGWGWQTPDKLTKLLKCAEFHDDCGQPATDGCCAVIPCTYCLTWEAYGSSPEYAPALFSGSGWSGTIAGAVFIGFWERNYQSGECEFVVTIDDLEVYRKSCYEGQSCRDSSDEVETTIGYDSGTLRWDRLEPRPLEYVIDYETGCRRHFCGTCECSCDCLCVTITDGYDSSVVTGEICDTSYPCDGPVWVGTIGDYELSLALGRDGYGECSITATVNGEEQSPVSAGGCGAMSATITLSDDTVIRVWCKLCDCSGAGAVPCLCLVEPGAIWCGFLTSGTVCAAAVAAKLATATTPTANKAWNDEDCVHVQQMRHLKNPFLGCMDPDNTKRVAWVQKRSDATTPFIDNDIVQKWDWYIVVYENAADTILSIHYEYEMCCINANLVNTDDTFLAWVKVFDVTLGPGVYDMVLYNPIVAAEHGNCGYDEPDCTFVP